MFEGEPQFFGKSEEAPRAVLEMVPEPERPLTVAEKEKSLESLKEFFKSSSAEMREEGIPVDERGRINMFGFKGAYPKEILEADREYVKEKKAIFKRSKVSEMEGRGFLPGLKERALGEEDYGEAGEMLTAAVLQRNLGDNFSVVRSSEYDDIRNGADTVILDRKTGNVVCALDEIANTKSKRLEEKQENILAKNLKGGGLLKYGLSLLQGAEGEKIQIKKGTMRDIPLFHCAFSKRQIEAALRGFDPSKDGSADEQKLFDNFLNSAREQIEALNKERLNPGLRKRLGLFEQSVLK